MQQISYEDVEVGMDVPSLDTGPVTLRDIVRWAGVSDAYHEIHYDRDYCRERGLPGPIIHGPYKAALLARMITDWIGPEGKLKEFSCRFRQMDIAGDALVCRGRVVSKYMRDGERLVQCEVWVENGKHETTTRGAALVALPCRY
jgi:acyl dehydratase